MVRQLIPCNKTKPFLKLSQKLRHYFLDKIHLFKKFQNISRYGIFHIYLIKYTSFWLDSDSIVAVALKLIVKIKSRHQNRVQHKNWDEGCLFLWKIFYSLKLPVLRLSSFFQIFFPGSPRWIVKSGKVFGWKHISCDSVFMLNSISMSRFYFNY